ncbi:MAG: TetR/AcrR family transcriptional regulator [Planctomycetota bacterium]|nr:TetR/AcrR family transcriptional regulator [Planctomycetota bacterium]
MTRNGGSQTRAAILKEARRVLLDQGYTSLSMRSLAGAIGCTPTTIYLYFKNKDALIHTLIDEGMNMLHGKLAQVLEETADSDSIERMRALAGAYFDFGLENQEYYEVMFMLHPQHMDRYPAVKYRSARRNLELFAEQLPEGPSRPVAGIQIWSALHGTISLLIAQRIDKKFSRDELRELAIEQAVAMVAARPIEN